MINTRSGEASYTSGHININTNPSGSTTYNYASLREA